MRNLLIAFLLSFALPAQAAQTVQNENTKATLISNVATVKPGDPIELGVLLEPRAGWHTYWENPGDAGIPTTLNWTLQDKVSVSDIRWPLPTAIPEDTLVVFGYKGPVLLPVTATLPEGFDGKMLPISVKASWLVCEKICVPESAELSIEIPVAESTIISGDAEQFVTANASLPKPTDTPLPYNFSGDMLMVALPEIYQKNDQPYLFLREQNVVNYSVPQTIETKGDKAFLKLSRIANGELPDTLSGYLTSARGAYSVQMNQSNIATSDEAVTSSTQSSAPSFLLMVIFAVLGGLILNLMPCVLPVLSLKALAIAKKGAHERPIILKQAFAYTAGILVSFAALAAVLISLQQAGQAVGWGFQMQSPVFVGAITILLFLVGLNLSGMFELPVLFGSAVIDTPQHSLRGSFFTGVLATAVATPCTAPFMATAVGATLALSPIYAMIVFLSIGFGLALPFLLISLSPALLRLLPKPGAWMEAFKQFLAFPMYASVVWLLWVLTMQTGADGLLVMLITLLLLAFIIWLKSRCKDTSPLCRSAIILLLLAALVNGLSALSIVAKPPLLQNSSQNHVPYSADTLAALRDAGTPVFVDATAAWCLTCQVNAKIAIHTQASKQAFADTNTVLMIADWTNRDDAITAFLKQFGHNGVPLYVYFPPHGSPVVLPQILSESLILSTLKGENNDQ